MVYITAKDYEEMSRKAANIISAQIISDSRSVLGLATGSTPVGVYEILAERYRRGDLDFSGIRTVNLDEYAGLDGDNPQSYRYFMNFHLFDKVNLNKKETHVPNGKAKELAAECAEYDKLIESLGIDLQLLGLGHNGHIGFNEPDNCFTKSTHVVSLSEKTIEANARFFESREEVPKKAVTMGMRGIMTAKKVLLIVSGAEKADILQKALYGPVTPEIPASILQLHPNLTVVAAVEDF